MAAGSLGEESAMVTVNETLVREILDRLIRLETLVQAGNEETQRRIEATNQRIDDTNERIGDTHRRIDDTNERIDRLDERYDKMIGRMDKLFYTMIGLGAAVIASLVAGQILD